MANKKQIKSATAKASPAEGRLEQQEDPPTRMAFSVQEAAQAVGLSERYVWDLVRTGKLRTKRCGRRRIVPATAIQEFLQ